MREMQKKKRVVAPRDHNLLYQVSQSAYARKLKRRDGHGSSLDIQTKEERDLKKVMRMND